MSIHVTEPVGYTVGNVHPTVSDTATVSPDLVQLITAALTQASAFDDQAREHRRRAGLLLAQARGEQPTGGAWYRSAGLDERSAKLLIELGCGARPAGHER